MQANRTIPIKFSDLYSYRVTSKQATGFHRWSSFETIDDMFERAESWMANPAMASRFSESIVSMKKQVWRFFVDALFELHFQE